MPCAEFLLNARLLTTPTVAILGNRVFPFIDSLRGTESSVNVRIAQTACVAAAAAAAWPTVSTRFEILWCNLRDAVCGTSAAATAVSAAIMTFVDVVGVCIRVVRTEWITSEEPPL